MPVRARATLAAEVGGAVKPRRRRRRRGHRLLPDPEALEEFRRARDRGLHPDLFIDPTGITRLISPQTRRNSML
jgi:hypothetical protein